MTQTDDDFEVEMIDSEINFDVEDDYTMIMNELQGAVEAILFAAGEPLETERICQALECEKEPVEEALRGIDEALKSVNSGIRLVKMDNMYQLCTRQEYADKVRAVLEIKKNTPLSSAAFEVLAVIAYNQPVTKSLLSRSEVLTAQAL